MTKESISIKHGLIWDRKLDMIKLHALDLFFKDGDNMSMRDLAKKIGISPSGLYRYVQDRRDLFFLCQNHVFAEMSSDFEKLVRKAQGDVIKSLIAISNYLLDLAELDFPRFRFMFLMEAPISKKLPGKYEIVCQRLGIDGLKGLLLDGINSGQIKISKEKIDLYTQILWGFVMGPGILISPMYDYFFVDEKMGWKKRLRDEVIKITINAIKS